MKWELTPDKFMSEQEVKRLLKTSEDKMLADRAKGALIILVDPAHGQIAA